MVNYRYNPRNVQALSAAYKRHSVVAASGAALLLQSIGDSMFDGLDQDTLAAINIPVHARVRCSVWPAVDSWPTLCYARHTTLTWRV